jgi:predicted nuclease with TOPRIM domain
LGVTQSEYQQLVEFLGGQFAAVDRRFGALERRFDALEHRVDEGFREVLGHFDEIYRRLERLEQEYYAIVEALGRIEASLADEPVKREVLERRVDELKHQVAVLEDRIQELEQRLRG